MKHDELLAAIAAIDPLDTGNPPAKGSARYDSILERAMQPTFEQTRHRSNDVDDTDRPATPARPPSRGQRPSSRARAAVLAVAAAVVTILTASVALLLPGDGVSPAAALTRAAATTREVTSLRAELTREDPYGSHRSHIEVAGDDLRIETRGTYADGHVEGSTTTYSGNQAWEQILGGDVQTYVIDDDERPAPFAASSAAVVTAALRAGDVADLGQEQVGDVEATHYRIDADDAARRALGELSPGQLGWFELEHPAGVRTIDIWVADDLIRRIRVVQQTDGGTDTPDVVTTTTDFYDFNADIRIEPPA